MGLQGYVGTSADSNRVRRQQQQREEERKRFEEAQRRAEESASGNAFKTFGAGSTEALERAFREETVGLVTKAQFAEKRATLQERYEEEQRQKKRAASELAQKERERKRTALQASANKLSFAMGDDEDEDEDEDAGPSLPTVKKQTELKGLGKNPDVETSFLPDKDREQAEIALRERLQQEFTAKEEAAKAKALKVVYSYWDGSGHRNEVTIKQGDSVDQFLGRVREQLASEFRELRATSTHDLLYIKEDVILPHSVTFHELIVNKARGKSGPLFHFDVHEDVRLEGNARIEKDESHAGKVVERHWYEKNKHIFPASRWEEYDPNKDYGKYTIFG